MDITGMNKAEILASLYNRSKTQGMGVLHYQEGDMTVEEAQEMLDQGQTYFDYVKGRVMKIELSGDELETDLFNRDNGDGVCERIIEQLKQ